MCVWKTICMSHEQTTVPSPSPTSVKQSTGRNTGTESADPRHSFFKNATRAFWKISTSCKIAAPTHRGCASMTKSRTFQSERTTYARRQLLRSTNTQYGGCNSSLSASTRTRTPANLNNHATTSNGITPSIWTDNSRPSCQASTEHYARTEPGSQHMHTQAWLRAATAAQQACWRTYWMHSPAWRAGALSLLASAQRRAFTSSPHSRFRSQFPQLSRLCGA